MKDKTIKQKNFSGWYGLVDIPNQAAGEEDGAWDGVDSDTKYFS